MVAGVLIAFGGTLANVHWSSATREGLPSIELDMVPSAFRHPLFNGESVPIGAQRGNWQVTKAKDGGRVLSGTNGWLDLMLSLSSTAGAPAHFELRLGVDPFEGAQAEVQFGHAASGVDDSRYVITLAKGFAQIGQRSGIEAPFQPLKGAAPLPLQTQADESPVYQDIRVQRQPNRWVVNVNGVEWPICRSSRNKER